ncbi:MAG: fibronectin type III domain-containing protein [Patescibacteria group bacterium]
MKDSNPISGKKTSKLKPLLGGLFAIGIFAGLLMLGSGGFQTAEKLKAEVAAAETDNAATASFTPASGKAGDLIYLVVENLENFSEEESGVFFGEEEAVVNTFGENEDGGITIVVEVPQLAEIGNYIIRIVTPTGMIESAEQFELTEVSATSALEDTEAEIKMQIVEAEDSLLLLETSEIEAAENTGECKNCAESAQPEEGFYTPTETEILISPPQNLQAVSTAAGIELSWEEPADEEAALYNIYYGTKGGSYIHRVASGDMWEIFSKNLASGQRYFFMVSAADASGNESNGSNEVSAIYSPSASAQTAVPTFHASSPKPAQLSEEGPAAAILISLLATLALLTMIFRKKILSTWFRCWQ